MKIQFECRQCHHSVEVGPELAGRKSICPQCFQPLVVPRLQANGRRVHALETDKANSGVQRNEHQPPPDTPLAATASMEFPPLRTTRAAESELRRAKDSRQSSTLYDSPADALWYVRPPGGGGQFGPASRALLIKWIDAGRIARDSWLWREGWDDWRPAAEVVGDASIAAQLATGGNASSENWSAIRKRTSYERARRRKAEWMYAWIAGALVTIGVLLIVLWMVVRGDEGPTACLSAPPDSTLVKSLDLTFHASENDSIPFISQS